MSAFDTQGLLLHPSESRLVNGDTNGRYAQGLTPAVAVSGIPGAFPVGSSAPASSSHPSSPVAVIRQVVAAGGVRGLYKGAKTAATLASLDIRVAVPMLKLPCALQVPLLLLHCIRRHGANAGARNWRQCRYVCNVRGRQAATCPCAGALTAFC